MSDAPIFDPMTNVDPMRAEPNEDTEDGYEEFLDGVLDWHEEIDFYAEMNGE